MSNFHCPLPREIELRIRSWTILASARSRWDTLLRFNRWSNVNSDTYACVCSCVCSEEDMPIGFSYLPRCLRYVPVSILNGGNILPFEPEFSGMLVKRVPGKKYLIV